MPRTPRPCGSPGCRPFSAGPPRGLAIDGNHPSGAPVNAATEPTKQRRNCSAPLAVLAGAETFVDIAMFGCKKLGLLGRFRPVQRRPAGARPSRRRPGHPRILLLCLPMVAPGMRIEGLIGSASFVHTADKYAMRIGMPFRLRAGLLSSGSSMSWSVGSRPSPWRTRPALPRLAEPKRSTTYVAETPARIHRRRQSTTAGSQPLAMARRETVFRATGCSRSYQSPYPVTVWAQLRLVSEAIRSGIRMSLFQPSQHASMIAS